MEMSAPGEDDRGRDIISARDPRAMRRRRLTGIVLKKKEKKRRDALDAASLLQTRLGKDRPQPHF